MKVKVKNMNMNTARKLYGCANDIVLCDISALDNWYSFDRESSDHYVLDRELKTVRFNTNTGATIVYFNSGDHVTRMAISNEGMIYFRIFS
jgi:hypothetical protein